MAGWGLRFYVIKKCWEFRWKKIFSVKRKNPNRNFLFLYFGHKVERATLDESEEVNRICI